MKRLCSAILAVCLIAGIAVPARAANEAKTDTPLESAEIVTVSTVEELIAAIEAAEDGDTIAISQKIRIKEMSIISEKDITIVRSETFTTGDMFYANGSTIQGLKFKGTHSPKDHYIFDVDNSYGDKTVFEDCTFDGDDICQGIGIYGVPYDESQCYVEIKNCNFLNCCQYAVYANPLSYVTISDCNINGTSGRDASGAITSSGNLTITDCTITDNTAVANAGVMCSGTLVISNCQIKDNTATNTNDKVAVDVFCSGVWSITDEPHQNAGYYDVVTGLKITLPVTESSLFAKLIYLSDDTAAEYFAPAPDDDDTNNEPPEPPQEPQTPEEGEDAVEPNEPSEDTTEDNNTTTTPPEPPQSDDDDEDDYTPPTSHKPVHRPSKPNTVIPEPKPAPTLACGDAVIDTSRSVVLEGYSNGQLHLEDTLSRAQMAKILYALLDDASVEKYDSGDSLFADVSSDSWYCRYVSAIARAGIVLGIGNGKYNPDAPLTWGHIITALSRFVEAEDYQLQNIQYDGWAIKAVETAVALGWIEDDASFDPDAYITRGEFVDFVNSILETYR